MGKVIWEGQGALRWSMEQLADEALDRSGIELDPRGFLVGLPETDLDLPVVIEPTRRAFDTTGLDKLMRQADRRFARLDDPDAMDDSLSEAAREHFRAALLEGVRRDIVVDALTAAARFDDRTVCVGMSVVVGDYRVFPVLAVRSEPWESLHRHAIRARRGAPGSGRVHPARARPGRPGGRCARHTRRTRAERGAGPARLLDSHTMESASPGVYSEGYFETRLVQDASREKVWRHLCEWFSRYVAPDADVLELGAGWCDFANHVTAGRVVAMDLDATVEKAAAPHVEAVVGDSTDLSAFEADSFDAVFASNLLEHLHRDQSDRLVDHSARVLRPGGRLILMQPNFRLNPKRYFDDYTHVSIFTDQSLQDYLASRGWSIGACYARFMPLTLKSKGSRLTFLVPYYLRSPVKPLAGQMLVVANPPVS